MASYEMKASNGNIGTEEESTCMCWLLLLRAWVLVAVVSGSPY